MDAGPLYDATAPITCTADGGELAARIEQVERMHANLRRIGRTEHGVLLVFPNRADVEADVRRFAVDEKGCCRFWGFAVEVTEAEVVLRWDAPPALDDYMDGLVARFESDEPITASDGLL